MDFRSSEEQIMGDIGRVGIIGGGGWLGSALAKAMVKSGTVSVDRLTCSFRSARPASDLGCAWTQDNGELVQNSEIVIVSVRPGDWPSIDVDASGKLVISVMAGVSVEDIKKRLGSSRIARALPNAAAEIGFSYTPYFVNSSLPADQDKVGILFRSCGVADAVLQEDHIDYFTAMSGSGAAFPALLAEAMMNDAISRGVPAEVALRAAQQIIIGSGRLQEHGREPPSETVKAFVDYKGTTAAGINKMRQDGFDAIVSAALEAAYQKARSLSD
jgi:pyrroline-5-carboxylate reductase